MYREHGRYGVFLTMFHENVWAQLDDESMTDRLHFFSREEREKDTNVLSKLGIKQHYWGLAGSPVVQTPCSQNKECEFDPWLGN